MKDIKKVEKEFINKIVDDRSIYGLFYACENDNLFIACDNLDGNAWIEEFETEEEAIKWLSSNEHNIYI